MKELLFSRCRGRSARGSAFVRSAEHGRASRPPRSLPDHCAAFLPYGEAAYTAPHPEVTSVLANLVPGAKVLLRREAYVLLSDTAAKEHASGCTLRSNAFAADLRLPKGYRSRLADYARNG